MKESKFGFKGRKLKSDRRRLVRNLEVLTTSKNLCKEHWHNFVQQHGDQVIDDTDINNLYKAIEQAFKATLSPNDIPLALTQRLRFFNTINRQREKHQLAILPTPVVAYRPQRPANTNEETTFLYLADTQKIVTEAFYTWQKKTAFTYLDSVTWLLFSLIIFGGHNEAVVIKAVYEALKDKNTLYLIDQHLMLPVDIISTEIANHVELLDNDVNGERRLTYSRWVFFDDVSRLWLSYLQRKHAESTNFPSWKNCVEKLGVFANESLTIDNFAKSRLLNDVSLYWQTLPNVYIDQQLVQVKIGQQKTTAITQTALIRYFQPITDTLELRHNQLNSEPLNESYSSNQQVTPTLKADIIKLIRQQMSGNKSNIIANLEQLYRQPLLPSEQRLVRWQIELAKNNNKVSTLQRYLSEIGNDFLTETRDTDFINWEYFDYELVYQRIIKEKNNLKKGYTQTVIASLHDVLVKFFSAPYLKLNRDKDPLVINARLIPVKLYQHILTSLEQQKSLSDYDKKLLKLMVILCYRTGMRFNEVLGLKISDIEYDNQNFAHYDIILRPNEKRDLKSDDANRRLDLTVLLLEEELTLFIKFFELKRQKHARYLFTPEYQSQPVNRHAIERPIQAILGEKFRDITLHSFRHNAISVLAMVFRADYDTLKLFTDYSESQCHRIKTHFLGFQREVTPNYWHALKNFAGHADLDTTFVSYVHTADLIAQSQLAQAQIELPIGITMKISGKTKRSFNEHNPQAIDFNTANPNVKLWHIRNFINGIIDCQSLDKSQALTSKNLKKDTQLTNLNPDLVKNQSSIFGKYSLVQVEKLLHDVESGIDLATACQASFEYEDALEIVNRATQLNRDAKGNIHYKFISKDRQNRAKHELISPTTLHYHEEQALAQRMFDKIEQEFQHKNAQHELQTLLQVFFEKAMTSAPEIRFPFKQQSLFFNFMDILLKILPSTYYRVNIHFSSTTAKTDKLNPKNYVQAFKETFPEFKGHLTQKTGYSGFTVTMIRPNARGKPDVKQPSSVVLKYVLHWLLIMIDFELPKIAVKSTHQKATKT